MMQIVKNVKNHIMALVKNESFVELFDVDNNSVIFYCNTPEEIALDIEATPDGEFLFSDGMKIKIEGGKVVSVENGKVEEEVDSQKSEEGLVVEKTTPTIEPGTIVEPLNETIETEEQKEYDEKEQLLKENEDLKIKLDELTKAVEELKSKLDSKEGELKEAEDCLKEVQNFYSKVTVNSEKKDTELKSNFYIK